MTCRTYQEVATAIRDMIIRGAPAIGVAAAMGVALGVLQADEAGLDGQMETICDTLASDTPDRGESILGHRSHEAAVRSRLRGRPIAEIRERLVAEAQVVREEDIAICRAIGRPRRGAGAGP